MARVLGRIRLSKFTVESTSVERQQEIIEQWSAMHGHEIVAWATDVDVSRSVDPFEAPELGPYFEPDHLGGWDIVACWKLDRIATGSIYLNRLMSWCFKHDKSLVSVTENLDLSTWVGRMVANVIAGVAEGELEAIRERTDASRAKLVRIGRWYGGTPPFGYQAIKNPGGEGFVLDKDPAEAPIVAEMYRRVADSQTPGAVSRWLNEEGHQPRRGGTWGPETVRRMIQSRWPLGQQMHKGRVAVGPDGLPIQRAPELVSLDTWNAAQGRLADRSVPKKRVHGVQLLLNVGHCGACGAPLYYVHNGRNKPYWRCRSMVRREGCTANAIPANDLEQWVEEQFLEQVGSLERTERVYHPAESNAATRARLESALSSIRKERDMGLYEGDDEGYFSRLKALTDSRKQVPDTDHPAYFEHIATGETYASAWGQMAVPERRQLMLDAGIVVKAQAKPFRAEFRVPHDILSRLQNA